MPWKECSETDECVQFGWRGHGGTLQGLSDFSQEGYKIFDRYKKGGAFAARPSASVRTSAIFQPAGRAVQ
jgi:hypothetical protein